MKKTIAYLILALLSLSMACSLAYSWSPAAHVDIAYKLGKMFCLKDTNEMYGSMAPSIFNCLFGYEFETCI